MLGTVRNIFTIFLGAMFYTEVISLNEFLGYAVALTGFAFYNVAKSGMCTYCVLCVRTVYYVVSKCKQLC